MGTTLPQLLIFNEEGYWEQPTWSSDPDDEEWVHTGWRAWSYEGVQHFRSYDKIAVQNFLAENGYTDTGDGAHYRRAES